MEDEEDSDDIFEEDTTVKRRKPKEVDKLNFAFLFFQHTLKQTCSKNKKERGKLVEMCASWSMPMAVRVLVFSLALMLGEVAKGGIELSFVACA